MSNYYKVTSTGLSQKNYMQIISEAFSGKIIWLGPALFHSPSLYQQPSLFQKLDNYTPDHVDSNLFICQHRATSEEISNALGDQIQPGTLKQDKYRQQMWHFTATNTEVARQLVSQGLQLPSGKVTVREFVPKASEPMIFNYLRFLAQDSSFRKYCSEHHKGWARIDTVCQTYPWPKKHRVYSGDIVSAIKKLSKEGFKLGKNERFFRPSPLKKSSVWKSRAAPAKSKAKSPANGKSKAKSKAPAKSKAKAPAKSKGKAPAKSKGKAPAKSKAKAPAKSKAKAPANGKSKSKAPAKRTFAATAKGI